MGCPMLPLSDVVVEPISIIKVIWYQIQVKMNVVVTTKEKIYLMRAQYNTTGPKQQHQE